MPTSNETRVRVEDLLKISAQVWPRSGNFELRPRSRLHAGAALRIASMSARGSRSRDNRCFMIGAVSGTSPKTLFLSTSTTVRHERRCQPGEESGQRFYGAFNDRHAFLHLLPGQV